ncbi:MAG: branched-chain amino acid ABC transporter permease [Rhodospirillales bacterium]|nr:branched-chain amino acid ABC transporter permease [Rhodospirillales bacterium]
MGRDLTLLGLTLALVLLLAGAVIFPHWLTFLVMMSLARGLVVLGIVLQMRAGLVSFGQGLYYCIGGYTAAMLGSLYGVREVAVLIAAAILVSAAVAFVLGTLLSRYRDIFFAMLSMAFSMILYGLLVKSPALGSTDGFNVPAMTFFGWKPAVQSTGVYVITCFLAYMIALAYHYYQKSPAGYLAGAIRENEIRVEYLGSSAQWLLHAKYVMASVISAVGGLLAALATGHVDPEMAYWTTSGEFVFIAILGGTGHVAAPFLGSTLFSLVRTYAYQFFPYTWQMILGLVLLLIIVFLPRGLWSLIQRLYSEKPRAADR